MQKKEILQQFKNVSPHLSVGILTADLMNLGSEIKLLENAGVQLLHIDVMDGKIWPKITIGSPFVQGIKTSLLKDVHLLIDKPENQIENFIRAGADILTFSVEYCRDIAGTLNTMGQMERTNEILIGLSLNPSTPVDTLTPFMDALDIVVLLAVGPDTGRSNFISELPERIAQVRKMKEDILIFVDGAVKKDNIAQVAAMRPNVIATGSEIFDGKDPAGNLKFMLDAIQ
jgi:ribulose-phosphate 3-epimerase